VDVSRRNILRDKAARFCSERDRGARQFCWSGVRATVADLNSDKQCSTTGTIRRYRVGFELIAPLLLPKFWEGAFCFIATGGSYKLNMHMHWGTFQPT
jgi:hypothetical protein